MAQFYLQQLIEPVTASYTYLLADRTQRVAVIIDPVIEMFERDLKIIKELNLNLRYTIDTHVHADHVTGSGLLAQHTGALIAMSNLSNAEGVDVNLCDGDMLQFGDFFLKAISTPGHTSSCMSFHINQYLFTGDTLLIRGNGRTDFQQGSSEQLYTSIHNKFFTLPEDTIIYPAHDYKGRTFSTIGDEKLLNERLGLGKSLEEFKQIMKNLKLDPPKKMNIAIPANLRCGRS